MLSNDCHNLRHLYAYKVGEKGDGDEVGVLVQSQLLLYILASNAGLITTTLYLGRAEDVGPAVPCQLLKSLALDCLHDCYYYGAMLVGLDDVKGVEE